MKFVFFIAVILSGLFSVQTSAFGQNQKTLESKKNQLLSDIKLAKKLLNENKDKQKASLEQLEIITRNVENRMALIQTYTSEIKGLEKEIEDRKLEQTELLAQQEALKNSYSKMIFTAYKNRNKKVRWLYILSAESLGQVYRRIRYFNDVASGMVERAGQIVSNQKKIEDNLVALEASRRARKDALNEQTREAALLSEDRKNKEELLQKLKSGEKDLKGEIDKKKRETDDLALQISKIIEEERKKATKPPTANSGSGSSNSSSGTSSGGTKAGNAEGSANKSGFSVNKGVLPWPVENGVITGKFGRHPHPVYENIEVKNDGIDITTEAGVSVRAVYAGEVSAVMQVDGFGTVVMIRHDTYLTVYANLKNVTVAKGNKVTAKQSIGTVGTDSVTGKSWMQFQIWYDDTAQNPTSWISK